MAVPPTTASRDVRIDLRKRRQAIAKQARHWQPKVPDRLRHLLSSATSAGSYLPFGGEPDPAVVLAHFTGVTSLPTVDPDNPMMTFRRWSPGDPTEATAFGVRQPLASAPAVDPDLILAPLLAFDAAGNRIGQGGGYYDRYLAAHPAALRIGIAWEDQRLDRIAAQPWDVPMDAILTERAFHVRDLTRCRHH